jgi:hypothetical protein
MPPANAPSSPRIADDAWARLVLADGRRFKDAKLWPGGAVEWDWNETGTDHSAGIQAADVDELLEAGADVVVLSRGRLRRLTVDEQTIRRLEAAGVEVIVLPTGDAIETYNALRQARRVGALIHTTC